MKNTDPAPIPIEYGGDAIAWAIWLYYGEGRTQSEVAGALRLSRATIANYLAEGRRRGLVSIEIAPDLLRAVSLAQRLKAQWGITAAQVVITDPAADAGQRRRELARAGGHALGAHMRPGAVIGVAWGRTVGELAVLLPETRQPEMSIVQVSGSSLSNATHSPEVCTALIAARTGARAENLHAPALLSTPDMRAALAREPGIARQLARTRECDVVVFGAGELDGKHVFADPHYMSAENAEDYMRRGAVGIILGRCIDPDGNEVEGPLSGRRMGMELADLRATPERMCVAAGASKTAALRAALKGGYITELITDAETAINLLEEEQGDEGNSD